MSDDDGFVGVFIKKFNRALGRIVSPGKEKLTEKLTEKRTLRDVYPSPGRRFGEFEIRALLNMGAFSAVYHARRNGRDCALKVLRPDMLTDPVSLDRFCREMDILGAVQPVRRQRDDIVKYYSRGTEKGIPYIELEYLDGHSLSEVIAHTTRGGRWSVRVLLEHMRSIAVALRAVHALGIVHRDVKPSNLFVVGWTPERPRVERLVLIDFGVAWAPESVTRLQTGGASIVGTATYMAPEQSRREPASVACDIFSLGAVLYRYVYGHSPYLESPNDPSCESVIVNRARAGDVLAQRLFQTDDRVAVPEPFKVLVLRALNADASLRHANMDAFITDMDRVIGDC